MHEETMNYEELREIGKVWILMGVFSTCFFASCGQNPTTPPESVTPVTHTPPEPQNREPIRTSIESSYQDTGVDSGYSEDLEGSGFGTKDHDERYRQYIEVSKDYPEDIPPS